MCAFRGVCPISSTHILQGFLIATVLILNLTIGPTSPKQPLKTMVCSFMGYMIHSKNYILTVHIYIYIYLYVYKHISEFLFNA